jgi:phosphoserine phosphatase
MFGIAKVSIFPQFPTFLPKNVYFCIIMAKEQILVRIAGKDRSGLTASIMSILAKYDAQVLDIGQADIHSTLSLGILIRIDEGNSGQVMKELLFKATELGVTIGFVPVPDDECEAWAGRQGRNRFILTMIGRSLSARQIEAAAEVIAEQGLNIDSIKRLSGRPSIMHPERNTRSCIEFSLRGTPVDKEALQAKLMHLSAEMGMDFSFQKHDMYRRMRRLICFDMDSTLIQTECIDELAERAGVGDKVKAITEAAMRGEIDFRESFTRRVALLKGLNVSVMQEIAENLPITEGTDRLMSVLKTCGYKIAILSGGFTFFGEYLQRRYGIDYVYANELEIDEDGLLTGRYLGEIVDGRRKADLLKLIAQSERVNLAQTIAVGDGANDLPMLTEAGLGIAFHAKPRVVANARQSINTIGLDGVLYFLGFKDSHLGEQGKMG